MDTGSFETCLYVGILVLILVVVVPAVDAFLCRKIGLNPVRGKNRTLKSNRVYVIRRILLFLGFAIYLAGFLYVTLFSRHAASNYRVHVELFSYFKDSLIDFGVLGYIINQVSSGAMALPSDPPSLDFSGITDVILNFLLFIPMGFFLPYLFKWFRRGVKLKVTVASFLISLCVENVQLITKLGCYDLDDLITNTFGGFLGGLLFIAFAFRVTHPNWRKERASYKRWKKNAKERTLYPYAKNMTLSRTFLRATDEGRIWDFYVKKLGFRVVGQLVPEDRDGTVYLLELGNYQLEILCTNGDETLGDELRKKASERPTSDEGVVLRRRRATDVETVFGDVKRNWGFRRFTLRGIEKVAHEWRLLMMGHNIRKLARKIAGAAANPATA